MTAHYKSKTSAGQEAQPKGQLFGNRTAGFSIHGSSNQQSY